MSPPSRNLVSGSLLCREGFKLVFESNKLVVTKYGLFVGKGYESGGMFHLSLVDFCNKVMNHIHSSVNESEVWHSRLCHISFGVMTRLAKLDLIPSFTLAKVAFHVCKLSNLASLTRLRRRDTWHH